MEKLDFSKYKNLKPIDDKIIIKKVDNTRKMTDGLYIPEQTRDSNVGYIVAVGPGLRNFNTHSDRQLLLEKKEYLENTDRYPMVCKVGDKVVYSTIVGQRVVVDGDELIIQRETELLYIINE